MERVRRMGLIAAACAIAMLLMGCASNAEDRAFFQEGWRHPEQGAEKRMNSAPW
jgi:hypothetical protein